MDCLRAQELVSDALDARAVERAELDAAKAHCRTCPECAAFVRGQLAVERAGVPAPPADLADRVIARVRAQAAADARAASVDAAAPAGPSAAAPAPDTKVPAPQAGTAAVKPQPARTWRELLERATAPRNRRALVAWAGAAAVLFIAAGIGGVSGMRAILAPPQASESALSDVQLGAAESVAPSAGGAAEAQSGELRTENTGARFITIGTDVYRFAAVATDVDDADLERIAETRSSLAQTDGARRLDVLGTAGATRVYVESDEGLLAFDPVTRTYAGRTYRLQSAPIESFGVWPTLPSEIGTPSSDDGSPVFEEAEPDASGVSVHMLKGSSADAGIAFPPGSAPGDPLAGSPEWSWWVP